LMDDQQLLGSLNQWANGMDYFLMSTE
jgi:hypothetical protein